MKIFNSNVRKLSLSIALVGMVMTGQSAWACEKPKVSGYDQIGCPEEGISPIVKDGKIGYVNTDGKVIVEPKYDPIQFLFGKGAGSFSGGLAVVNENGKLGFIDKTGTVVIPIQYNYIGLQEWDRYVVTDAKIGDKKVRLTKLGGHYDTVGKEHEGRRWTYKDGLYGYVDADTNLLVSPIYQDASDFQNGLAYVKKDGKYGYIDNTGKVVIDFRYTEAKQFYNGQARVSFGNDGKSPKYFYIDKTGKILTDRSILLADFRKKLEQGDDVSYQTNDDFGRGMIFEIKGNLVQVQTKESQCSQRDYKGNCQNYIENQVGKWVKKSEVYPINHFD